MHTGKNHECPNGTPDPAPAEPADAIAVDTDTHNRQHGHTDHNHDVQTTETFRIRSDGSVKKVTRKP